MEGVSKGMPSKLLEREETLPANSLRSLSQKALLEMVSNYEKLGLIVNNELSIAMLSWEKYERIVDLIQTMDEKIAEYESIIEDFELAQMYGDDVVRAEKDKNASYEIDTAEDLFRLLDE
jgi:hypothetical protein